MEKQTKQVLSIEAISKEYWTSTRGAGEGERPLNLFRSSCWLLVCFALQVTGGAPACSLSISGRVCKSHISPELYRLPSSLPTCCLHQREAAQELSHLPPIPPPDALCLALMEESVCVRACAHAQKNPVMAAVGVYGVLSLPLSVVLSAQWGGSAPSW